MEGADRQRPQVFGIRITNAGLNVTRACLSFIATSVGGCKSANQGARRAIWLIQISDEQSRVVFFQSQPEGPRLFSHLTALSIAYVE